ncbi:hypothetical protein CBM2589_B60042 [Cupriavidus taiwanensis]|uniref:Uncharacterized protein n=1 Tax=Cupriavidus taiwanensis TaxID=164546 RepID=A0A975X4G6_9BURK|nr:hypothetical protein CBM2589_B60042 [Cupriavidus taiwanensis]
MREMPFSAPHTPTSCAIRCFAPERFFAMQHEMAARRNKSGTFWIAPGRRGARRNIAKPVFSMT